MHPREHKEYELFNRISLLYTQKDIYPLSKIARKFHNECVKHFIFKTTKKKFFKKTLEVGCGSGANSQYYKTYYKLNSFPCLRVLLNAKKSCMIIEILSS